MAIMGVHIVYYWHFKDAKFVKSQSSITMPPFTWIEEGNHRQWSCLDILAAVWVNLDAHHGIILYNGNPQLLLHELLERL